MTWFREFPPITKMGCLRAAGLAAVVLTGLCGCGEKSIPLGNFSDLGDFALTERSGQTITQDDLRGSLCVVNFFFASCSAQCLQLTQTMARIQERVRGMDGVRLVSITVDPRSDTPESLTRYAAGFKADRQNWLFLTGDRDAVYAFIRQRFLLPAAENLNKARAVMEQDFIHSDKFAVVDARGSVRAYVSGSDPDCVDQVLNVIRQLRKE